MPFVFAAHLIQVLQVKALPRLGKSPLLEDALPTPCSKKDIFL
jgi:hypothetical protein